MSNPIIPRLVLYAQDALAIQERFLPQIISDDRLNTHPEGLARTLCILCRYLLDRGRSVLALLENRLDWDAEILLRTYYECASKILFIALSPPNRQAEIVWEFWVPLGETADRKTSRKAAFAEHVFPETDNQNRNVFRLLRDPRMVRDTLKLNKAARRRLAHKWSFSEIIEALTALQLDDRKITEARSLLHNYGMASHLAHADCNAMDLMADRALRHEDELPLLQDAHAGRIASDVVGIGFFSSHVVSRTLDIPEETLDDLLRQYRAVMSISQEITNRFHASQQFFYESMLGTPND